MNPGFPRQSRGEDGEERKRKEARNIGQGRKCKAAKKKRLSLYADGISHSIHIISIFTYRPYPRSTKKEFPRITPYLSILQSFSGDADGETGLISVHSLV